jgi:HD-like signal output (HDOD) protein
MQTVVDRSAILDAAARVEPLPVSVTRLASLVNDDRTDIREIVEVITFDPLLTGALLRASNSVTSATARQISTVHEAVVRVGLASVLSLAMAHAISPRLRKSVPGYGLEAGDLWTHAVSATLAAEEIRTRAPAAGPAAVTAALLHDLGKLVLAEALTPNLVALIRRAAEQDHASLPSVEREVFGMDHAEVGGIVAQQWNLPEPIVDGVAFHHDPSNGTTVIPRVTALADLVANRMRDIERGVEPGELEDVGDSWQCLALDPDDFDDIVAAAIKRYQVLAPRFG